LPLVIQLPFLIGFYNVLRNSIEMRHAEWISPWVSDLSSPENLPIRLLPLIMCGTQFAMQKMTPTPGVDPMQQKMMLFMPVMFLFMFYNQASGLVLYWIVGNVMGIAQQWYFNRTHLIQQVEAKQAKKKKTQK
jgi:YidC/Oxa1 family membrane protein insertase